LSNISTEITALGKEHNRRELFQKLQNIVNIRVNRTNIENSNMTHSFSNSMPYTRKGSKMDGIRNAKNLHDKVNLIRLVLRKKESTRNHDQVNMVSRDKVDLQKKNFCMTENNFRVRKGIIFVFIIGLDKTIPNDIKRMKMTTSNFKQVR
jgi:hypothetical protein